LVVPEADVDRKAQTVDGRPPAGAVDPFTYSVHAFKSLLLKNTCFAAIGFEILFLTVFSAIAMTAGDDERHTGGGSGQAARRTDHVVCVDLPEARGRRA
jgi:hypothetical protein